MDDPNADTEWNDILRAKGILPPKPAPEVTEEQIAELLEETIQKKTGERRLEDMNLDELDELEDDEDEEILEKYRQQRLAELREKMARAKFGTVIEISKPDYIREVNQAGEGIWVVLHLYSNSVQDSKILSHHMNALAAKYPATKFISILSTRCIENYPDKNLPSVFIYREGEMKASLIGPAVWGDVKNIESVEFKLGRTGAIETDLQEDPAARRVPVDVLEQQLRQQREDSDDEW